MSMLIPYDTHCCLHVNQVYMMYQVVDGCMYIERERDTHGKVDNVKKEYLYCCRLEQDNNINKINTQ